MICVELSIDDGAVSDLEIADILTKYSAKATFYIPCYNIESIPVLSNVQIAEISKNFQIGGHGTTHRYLNLLSSNDELFSELKINKMFLEDVIQCPVDSFCFPGGRFSNTIASAVWDTGYKCARTTRNFSYKPSNGRLVDTSFQFYPHTQLTLTKNLIKNKQFFSPYARLCGISNFSKRLDYVYELIDSGSVKYLSIWLHSWELNEFNGFRMLSDFLEGLAGRDVVYVDIS